MTEQEWLKVNQWDAIRVSEYKGKYSIQQGRRGEKKVFASWVIPTRYDKEAGSSTAALKDNGDYLNVPLQVPSGEGVEVAANMLRALYFQLVGKKIEDRGESENMEPVEDEGDLEPPLPPPGDDESWDVPF